MVKLNKLVELSYDGVIYSKKNSKSIIRNSRTGKPMLISSKNARKMEQDMAVQFTLQMHGKRVTDGEYEVEMTIHRKDNTRRDLDNMATSCLDALVLAGALPDDSIKYVKKLTVTDMGVDKLHPRALITIYSRSKLES